MFHQIVKKEIESATQHLMSTNILTVKAQRGDLQKAQVVKYLKNCLYIVSHTPIHLKKAIHSAQKLGLSEVVRFMDDKFREEVGHDEWAKTDISSLGESPEIVEQDDLTNSIHDLIRFIESLIESNPHLYVAYITFVEYFTVLAAPAFLESIEKCGVPRTSMTVIANHGELDKNHVHDDLSTITLIIDTPEKQAEFIKVLKITAQMIDAHFTECAEAA